VENNQVRLAGVVKRDAKAGSGVIDFAIEVIGHKERRDIFDCRATAGSLAYESLEGFVNEGEPIEVMGHLIKMTTTEEQRVNGVWLTVRNTRTVVYVDSVITED
jgi:hypothetical protein